MLQHTNRFRRWVFSLLVPPGLPIFASKLWGCFELCELEGNQRAAKDPEWAALLARVRVGQQTEQDIQILQSRVVNKHSANPRPSPEAVHLFATRDAVANHNSHYIQNHIERTGSVLYECPSVDVSVKTGAPLPAEKAWPRADDTGGLEALLTVAEGAQVMLRKNLDVGDGLVNGARGTIQGIDLHQ